MNAQTATALLASVVVVGVVSKKISTFRALKREAASFEETVASINLMMNKQDETENVVHLITSAK